MSGRKIDRPATGSYLGGGVESIPWIVKIKVWKMQKEKKRCQGSNTIEIRLHHYIQTKVVVLWDSPITLYPKEIQSTGRRAEEYESRNWTYQLRRRQVVQTFGHQSQCKA